MKQIDLTQVGGMPFDQQTLEFMQEAYTEPLKQLAAVYGDYVVLSGTQATGGWVAVKGEVMPLDPGAGDGCYVQRNEQSVMFGNGQVKGVYSVNKLVFGTGALRWSSFKSAKLGVDRSVRQLNEQLPRRYGEGEPGDMRFVLIQDHVAKTLFIQGQVQAEGYTHSGGVPGVYLQSFYSGADWVDAILNANIIYPTGSEARQNIPLAGSTNTALELDPLIFQGGRLTISFTCMEPSINYFAHTFYCQ